MYHFPPAIYERSSFSTSSPTFIIVCLLIIAIQMNKKVSHCGFDCISLMISDVKHTVTYILAICISSLKMTTDHFWWEICSQTYCCSSAFNVSFFSGSLNFYLYNSLCSIYTWLSLFCLCWIHWASWMCVFIILERFLPYFFQNAFLSSPSEIPTTCILGYCTVSQVTNIIIF